MKSILKIVKIFIVSLIVGSFILSVANQAFAINVDSTLINIYWSYILGAVIAVGMAVGIWKLSKIKYTIQRLVITVLIALSTMPGCSEKKAPPKEPAKASAPAGSEKVDKEIEPLIKALGDKVPNVRWNAAEALGKIGDTRAVEPLIKALGDENWLVRENVATALGKFGDPRAVEPFIKALGDEDWRVRENIATALGKFGDPRTVEPLIKALGDRNSDVRKCAAGALGGIGDTRAVEPLIKALADGNFDVRMYAAGALGEIGDAKAVEPLIKALGDKEDVVRQVAAAALGKIGDPKAVEPLIKALTDGNRWVRKRAAEALGEIGDAKVVEPLIKSLGDENYYVRESVAKALDKMSWEPRSKIEEIKYYLAKREGDKLAKIGVPAVEPLIKALGDENDDVRSNAARALGNIGDPRAVEPLIKALGDGYYQVRMNAAGALGDIGDQRAVPKLQNALADWDVGPVVSIALQKLGWQPTSNEERIRFNVAERDKQALLQDWEVTRKVLLADIDSRHYFKVKNAVYAFVGIGKEEALDDLINILNAQETKEMAETFLNCGNELLSNAAREWAGSHGYRIGALGGSLAVRWGRM